ncbi:MAG: biotin/lipoyl-binding protein, partial [Betaproteobacteria bacterium]|nr:biotin/lipoyl-binding protein [Betaproteobacteria bacterium]
MSTVALNPTVNLRRIVGLSVGVMALGLAGLGMWAAFAPLSGAVIAPGFVKVDMNRKVVQHQEGGIVKQILVRDGDRVQHGQTLMVLEDVRVDATIDLLKGQLDGERAKAARLEAERALQPAIAVPRELEPRAAEAKVAEILQREQSLFRARR